LQWWGQKNQQLTKSSSSNSDGNGNNDKMKATALLMAVRHWQ